MKIGLSGLVLVTLLGAVSAAGQIMSNPGQWYINNQIYSTRVFNGVVASSMLRKKGGKTTAPAPKNDRTAADNGVFKRGPDNLLPKRLAAKSASGETERVFDAFIDLYRQTAQKDGFPADDLAYAFEYFVVNNYQIYHDLVELPADKDPRARRARDGFERIQILNEKKLRQVSINQERAVYGQFRRMLAASPELAKMTDAQKQEGAELRADRQNQDHERRAGN